jgi:hypothetical protein
MHDILLIHFRNKSESLYENIRNCMPIIFLIFFHGMRNLHIYIFQLSPSTKTIRMVTAEAMKPYLRLVRRKLHLTPTGNWSQRVLLHYLAWSSRTGFLRQSVNRRRITDSNSCNARNFWFCEQTCQSILRALLAHESWMQWPLMNRIRI